MATADHRRLIQPRSLPTTENADVAVVRHPRGISGHHGCVLVLRPSSGAIITAAVVQFGSVALYELIQRSAQGQSQRNAHKLLEQAKDGGIAVTIHETGRIDIIRQRRREARNPSRRTPNLSRPIPPSAC
jgi:hypothetical protein